MFDHRLFLTTITLGSLGMGCAAPLPEAPTDLNELSLYLFKEFENDNDVLASGLLNLDLFLEGLDWATLQVTAADNPKDSVDREWEPDVLDGADLGGLSIPEGAFAANQIPVALAWRSPHTPVQHAALLDITDQTPFEAKSAAQYNRTVLTGADCFLDQSCDRMNTSSFIQRVNPLMDVPYTVYEDYRWITLPDDGGQALVSRSWTEEVFFEDDDSTSIEQSFSLEIVLPHAGASQRYFVLWSSADLGRDYNRAFIQNLIADGINEIFVANDCYIETGENCQEQ